MLSRTAASSCQGDMAWIKTTSTLLCRSWPAVSVTKLKVHVDTAGMKTHVLMSLHTHTHTPQNPGLAIPCFGYTRLVGLQLAFRARAAALTGVSEDRFGP